MTETDFRIYIDETLYFCAGSFFMPIGGTAGWLFA